MKRGTSGRREPIDWSRVKARLAAAWASAEASTLLSPERAEALLDERARALARAPAAPAPGGERVEAVAFTVAGGRYAVPTRHVREVVRLERVTPVPGAPVHLAGLASVRGEVLALFDFRRLLGLAERGPASATWVIVLGDRRPELGLVVDAAEELVALGAEEILPPPEKTLGAARLPVLGVTREAVAVLDAAALLSLPTFTVDQRELASH